ncbi:Hypothetical protein PHPALM_15472 [Phytophthora palmivora]|uniref:PiggyBac transposable element-derived protein domain-containing protein n=1 Tax=Phytophthora palmivora TaxID=4796 RepID=A0A2P4XS36_9STRA|nr:Hypothetical protein PHPALM_15472 [Phytophthora palmivora]
MEIVHLLNADGEDWAFEPSDTEEEEEGAGVLAADDEGERNETQTAPQPLPTGNAYIDGIMRDSGLHIVREGEVRASYKERGELGLFSLFFMRDFRDSLRTWTNQILKDKGKPEATVYELDAYMGLEIVMSFNPVTEMKELWSQKVFMGQSDFAATMARNRFETIRAAFQIHAPDSVPAERCDQDPLWHSRRLMTQIQNKFAAIAVPVGAVSLDENTVRTKARSSARTYLPSKPDKYGVRFYAVVGWKSLYAYSIWDNGSGNRTRATPAERYIGVFPALRTALFRTLERSDVAIKRKDASALWVAMSGHLTKIHAAPNCHRLLVCDIFYTRHNLAKTLLAFTDGEMRMLGTVRIPLQGKGDTIGLDSAKARVAAAERGSWELIAAIDVPVGWEKLQEKHNREQQKLPAHLRTPYKPPMSIAENAGYVVYRDKNTVVFYTNDLAGTMAEPMLPGTSTEAVRLCRGLAPFGAGQATK